jgi:signal transduction histidine kinase
LRTPLNAIAGWLQILKSDNLNEKTREKALNTINRNLRLQVNLVEDMIIFSDQDYLESQNNGQHFSFRTLTEECLEEINFAVKGKNLELTLNLSAENAEVAGIPDKLKRTIFCLLNNAVKFTPKGGKISVELISLENQLQLKVIDSGEGISPQMIPHIFDKFSQSDSSTTRKYGGLGLGLAVAQKIIESHQGKITAESAGKDKGSTFIITLPLADNSGK